MEVPIVRTGDAVADESYAVVFQMAKDMRDLPYHAATEAYSTWRQKLEFVRRARASLHGFYKSPKS
jgi:hypothetical protein